MSTQKKQVCLRIDAFLAQRIRKIGKALGMEPVQTTGYLVRKASELSDPSTRKAALEELKKICP